MVRPRRERPADVIALSPFRAEIGRGRRLRRADVLLAERDLESAVQALPGDELYYVVHELGLRDAGAILNEATAEQLQIVLDFAVWERDRIAPGALSEWLAAMAEAPPDRIGQWLAGLDTELVALVIRRGADIYDLSQGDPPAEPQGSFFPTPDGLFVLDVRGLPEDPRAARSEDAWGSDGFPGASPSRGAWDPPRVPASIEGGPDSAAVIIRLVDSLYRSDRDLARRLLVGAAAELDAELEETAHRWRQGRMADLGFADYYEALEVYRALDPASVRVGDAAAAPAGLRPRGDANVNGAALRVPTALAQRLADAGGSPFARAAQALAAGDEIDDLHFALVALTNRVLAADRVAPGDDDAVTSVLERLAATLDLAIERLAAGDDARATAALRTVPLVRLFRLGVSLIGKVRELALALVRGGPFGARGRALAEPADATVLAAVTRLRPLFPRLLDTPPAAGERPFRSLADLARATAAVERAAAAQAMLLGLGLTPADVTADSGPLLASDADEAAVDTGVLARTAIVARLLGRRPARFGPLAPGDVRAFEASLRKSKSGPPALPDKLRKAAQALLAPVIPPPLAVAGAEVTERWIASLAPLESTLVLAPPTGAKPRPPARSARQRPRRALTRRRRQ
jgi:hypothetical protein